MKPHKRTRTGCWTCREAGYKCDELKPQCGRCTRLGILCKGYGVKLKWRNNNISTPVNRPRRNKKKEPIKQHLSSSPDSSTGSSVASPSSDPSQKGSHASPESTNSLSFPPASPPLTVDLPSSDRWLLQYWAERLSNLISVAPKRGQTTPFQLHLTAMAYDSTALRSTILCMAANHLSLSINDPSLRLQAYHHQQNAISSLQKILQNPVQAPMESTFATILMMQVSARLLVDENEGSIANHLAGAKAIIAQYGGVHLTSPSSTTRFLLSLFAYHDILMSVSRGARPLLDHDRDFTAIEGEETLKSIAKVLLIVSRISQLQHMIKVRNSTMTDVGLTEVEDAIGREIQQSLLDMDLTGSDQRDEDEEDEIRLTAEAYRHAAFIYLYRTWLEIGAPNPISMDHVSTCLNIIKKVRVESPLTTAHVWPLFTAGCEAINNEDRQFVRDRFEAMYSSRRFPSLRHVMRDIEDVWAAKDMELETKGQDGMTKVDCIQVILRNRGREVSLT